VNKFNTGKEKMIISASRRTDIPNYYSEWFYNRIKEGFVYVRNPRNVHQVSRIDLSKDVVDIIVFWTKNPEPMFARLDELAAYHYCFQFTLTGYGKDIERNIPHKKEKMIPVFRELASRIGKQKVVWRYDPILFAKKYTPEYHLRAFRAIAEALKGYTEKCVISFVDLYACNRKNMEAIGSYSLDGAGLQEFAKEISRIAGQNGMKVGSCAENIDLGFCGIEHNCCIDKEWIENIIGCRIKAGKDKNQRPECGCMESVEIGAYDTCRSGCIYCYANRGACRAVHCATDRAADRVAHGNQERVMDNCGGYDPASPILCGRITAEDKISIRRGKSLKEEQLSLLQ